MSNQKTFHLSADEAEYLSTLVLEDRSLRDALSEQSEPRDGCKMLTLTHAEAELLRDYFTERLARVGFDENYKPNQEGAILEVLIDRLFLTDEEWSAG